MTEDVGAVKAPLPPYIAFKTLTDLVERMEREEPPTRVDPSYLDSYAGGYRPTVISNLQTLGLLHKSGEPTERLLALVAGSEADRQKLVGDIVTDYYSDILALGRNATQGQFLEAFADRGARGDTRRKAIAFFMKACKFADIPLSTHWKTPPASTGATTRKKPPASPKLDDDAGDGDEDQKNTAGSGETVVIDLGKAGRVTVNVDVAWLALDDDAVAALRKGIKTLQSLESLSEASKPAESADSDDDEDDEELVS